MSQITATIIEASLNQFGRPIYTYSCKYHRFIHGEVMTHRDFSRNAMSSRAVPVRKILSQVWNDPAIPVEWGANVSGMQAHNQLSGWRRWTARKLWVLAGRTACVFAWGMMKVGLAKQVANRLLEPWQLMYTVITSTEWSNFYDLRLHRDAQPEFRVLARAMRDAANACGPRTLSNDWRDPSGWHLPYISIAERASYPVADLLKFSTARCARVSYLTHEGREPVPTEDAKLYTRLVGSEPLHASPIEHQACGASRPAQRSNNFRGFIQHREVFSSSPGMLFDNIQQKLVQVEKDR